MSLASSGALTALYERWLTGEFVGDATPWMQVSVRKVHLARRYDASGRWGADLIADTQWKPLPNVKTCTLDQNFDQNGITVCTLDISNVTAVDLPGGGVTFERGWMSPWRSYRAPGVPAWDTDALGRPRISNEWDRFLSTAVQVQVQQGYGIDAAVTTFTGLADQVGGGALPDSLKLTARCFGQLLVDQKLFGWNVDPKIRGKMSFSPESWIHTLESGTTGERRQAELMRAKHIITTDITDMVIWSLRWAGFPEGSWIVEKTGTNLLESQQFDMSATHMDVIRKAQDLTGFTFYIGEPSVTYPMGRPTFRRTRAVVTPMTSVLSITDDKLLTGADWQTDDTNKSSIIRVRGKTAPTKRGGRPLGDLPPAILGVYRPPWHRNDRDARILKHRTVIEPLYKTQQAAEQACRMIALSEAMSADTATVEIPCYPGVQLDDIVFARDHSCGLNSRAWVASKTSTFETGENASWKQTLGTGLLDTPDVVDVLNDLRTGAGTS